MSVAVASMAMLLLGIATAMSQQLHWNVDFNTVFDNREGDNTYTSTETYFKTRLAPEIGISMLDGAHVIAGGAVWNQPIGSEWDGHKISPTLYYRYSSERWRMSFGMFPRTHLVRMLPNYVWNDSSYYWQANVRGLAVQYLRREGYFEAVVDWRSMQSETQREAFNIIASGEWKPRRGLFLVGGLAMMNHLALQKNAPADQHIVDNIVVNPYVGIDASHRTALDSLSVRAGMLMGITRNREFDKWEAPAGLWLDVAARWRWLGVKNTLFTGKAIYPYYSTFGPVLNQGEAYYASKFYNRTDVSATILNNSFMNLEASLVFNLAEDNFTFYQRLLLRVYIDRDTWSGRRSKKSRLANIY